MFGAYLHLVIWLGDIQQEAAKWTEGCACHGDLLIGTRKDRRANIMRKRFKHDIGDCKIKGKQLPEIVAGETKTIFDRAERSVLKLLAVQQRTRLTAKQWLTLSKDFESGIALLWAGLEVKLNYASKLPVLLAGMVHSDEDVARKVAAKVVEQFHGQDPQHESLNHHLTLRFMNGDMRRAVLEFVGGRPRCELPELFGQLLPWKCGSVVERYIGAAHSIVQYRASTQSMGPWVSLARRLPRLEIDLLQRPQLLSDVVDAFIKTRRVLNISSLLGIALHPKLPSGMGTRRFN